MSKENASVTLTIDGVQVQVPQGFTILAAAKKAGIRIPTLCFLKDVSDIGMCRVCSVEVEGCDNLVAACKTPVTDGMQVRTATEHVQAYRKMMLELVLAEHGLDSTNYCFSCAKNGACELQSLCRELGVTESAFARKHATRSSRSIPTCASRASAAWAHATTKLTTTRCKRARRACARRSSRRSAAIGRPPIARAAAIAPPRAPRALSR